MSKHPKFQEPVKLYKVCPPGDDFVYYTEHKDEILDGFGIDPDSENVIEGYFVTEVPK